MFPPPSSHKSLQCSCLYVYSFILSALLNNLRDISIPECGDVSTQTQDELHPRINLAQLSSRKMHLTFLFLLKLPCSPISGILILLVPIMTLNPKNIILVGVN